MLRTCWLQFCRTFWFWIFRVEYRLYFGVARVVLSSRPNTCVREREKITFSRSCRSLIIWNCNWQRTTWATWVIVPSIIDALTSILIRGKNLSYIIHLPRSRQLNRLYHYRSTQTRTITNRQPPAEDMYPESTRRNLGLCPSHLDRS